MFEDYQICPYTGLRSFTEEESLYFKGREEHIDQATEQLQRNKFLMLTGASGDGKSSLVYAGIVPNARAGFLKSKYTQWSVADFRPERTPFKNLCRVLAKQLDIANAGIVESELQHGFSALVDLYKNSKCFIDVDSVAWQQADDAQKAALKRSASNLIIIVDQFEEFFTNPENYHHGVPSRNSNLVLNILLETARIALEENLPIYIVFTMRSDYIGQCAAFRSLPEYIGFSQFFVPRLNRSQLQQVIEEPATLSGNRISRRLTERLIHDISEGVDQLPILQHALNQIWHAASQGREEMDLIHYAMVGGMPVNELPDDLIGKFSQWFNSLPDKVKQFYQEPNLQNVLDTHANKLYESAAEHYRIKTKKELSDDTAKAIVKTAFTCLTKIDQSRAVRNRMTLLEITSILGRPELTTSEVGAVLDIFREPGNTFVRPFIMDEIESNTLTDADVLDITHESLIRNWEYLKTWAKEDFDNYSISLDFEKQLSRWVESGKTNGFLLSVGPLTYFENWLQTSNPNAHWIARYLPEEIDERSKLNKAKEVLTNSQEFLKRSARKHVVTRTIMRYGPRRIAAVLGVFAVIILSSFAVRDYLMQQNSYVLKNMRQEILGLMNSSKIDVFERSELLCESLQDDLISVHDISDQAKDKLTAINVASLFSSFILFQGMGEPQSKFYEGLILTDSLFTSHSLENSSDEENQKVLKELALYNHTLELAYLYNPSQQIIELRKRNVKRCAAFINFFFTQQPTGFTSINTLNRVLEHAVNNNAFTEKELRQLVFILSPFDNAKLSEWVLKNYHVDKQAKRSVFEYGFKFNGLFQELAYLYAALGETSKALQSIDSLLYHNQSYHQNDYAMMLDNAANITSVFYTSGNSDKIDDFVNGYCYKKKIDVTEFYERLFARSVFHFQTANNSDPTKEFYSNGNLQYSTNEETGYFFEKLRQGIIKTFTNPAERDFNLALSYKNEGVLKAFKLQLRNEDSPEIFELYKKAFSIYEKIDPGFLKKNIRINGGGLQELITVQNSFLFIYPDYRTRFHPFEPRTIATFYTSDSFMKFIVSNNLSDKLYQTAGDVLAIEDWFRFYIGSTVEPPISLRKNIDYNSLVQFEAALRINTALKTSDLSMLYLQLGERAFELNRKQDFVKWVEKLKPELIFNSVNLPFGNRVFRSYAEIIMGLIHYDLQGNAYQFIQRFKNPVNRSSLYAFGAYQFVRRGISADKVNSLLDSAHREISRIENLSAGQPNRVLICYALALQNDDDKLNEAYKVIKNLEGKSFPMQLICRTIASQGNLFKAIQNIPSDISDGDRAQFLRNILQGYLYAQTRPEWKDYSNNYFWFNLNPISYVNESI